MTILATSPTGVVRYRRIAYWSTTALVAAELGLGGIWATPEARWSFSPS